MGPAAAFCRQALRELHQAVDLFGARPEVDRALGLCRLQPGREPRRSLRWQRGPPQGGGRDGGFAELSKRWQFKPSEAFAAALGEFDSVRTIGRSQAACLLQYATGDALVAPENGEQLLAAAPEPKRLA
jgi:hypothetical protein